MNIGEIKFNHHIYHNPNCDILEKKIDENTHLTFGIYVKGDKKGVKFCEVYIGKNYVLGSTKRSYSKYYEPKQIPPKYFTEWLKLYELYIKKYK